MLGARLPTQTPSSFSSHVFLDVSSLYCRFFSLPQTFIVVVGYLGPLDSAGVAQTA